MVVSPGLAETNVQHIRLRELINPHPRQLEFLEAMDKYPFTLYGGARGGGKSRILRWAIIRFLFLCSARGLTNVRAGMFCETFPELKLRQIEPARIEFPAWLGTWNVSEYEFRFKPEYGSHVIKFCNLDDVTKYQGGEFGIIAVDELTLLADRGVLDILRACLRWVGIERPPFIAATNPTGPGHSWVKRLWITKDFSSPDDKALKPEWFHFVRSLPRDNPHLSASYIEENLAGLPAWLRAPWLEGSWDIIAGQRFEQFNPLIHVCKPFDLSERGAVKYFRSIDYGASPDPYACLWIAVVQGERPDVYVIQEDVAVGLNARTQAKQIHGLTKNPIEISYLDTQCWAEEDEGLSIATKFMQEDIPVTKVLKDRVTGWAAVDDLLYYESDDVEVTKRPRLNIFSTCPILIQQLTDAMADPKRPGDILHPQGFRDDLIDALRYFALTHIRKPVIPKQSTQFDYMRRVHKAMTRR